MFYRSKPSEIESCRPLDTLQAKEVFTKISGVKSSLFFLQEFLVTLEKSNVELDGACLVGMINFLEIQIEESYLATILLCPAVDPVHASQLEQEIEINNMRPYAKT